MNDTLRFVFSLMAGAVLGILFFGGLWWTIRRGLASHRPAVWFVASPFLRLTVVLVGFYVLSAGDSGRLLTVLVGFLGTRTVMMYRRRDPRKAAISSWKNHP